MTTEKNIQQIGQEYASKCHRETNHLYNGQPYTTHLEMVVGTANKFIHLIPESDRGNVIAACWCHDVIEDTRQTYNDVKAMTNETVAELVYALTNDKGKNRKERAGKKYYDGIKAVKYASFVKMCDRIANIEYSKRTKSHMLNMYIEESDDFVDALYKVYLDEMWAYYHELLFSKN